MTWRTQWVFFSSIEVHPPYKNVIPGSEELPLTCPHSSPQCPSPSPPSLLIPRYTLHHLLLLLPHLSSTSYFSSHFLSSLRLLHPFLPQLPLPYPFITIHTHPLPNLPAPPLQSTLYPPFPFPLHHSPSPHYHPIPTLPPTHPPPCLDWQGECVSLGEGTG